MEIVGCIKQDIYGKIEQENKRCNNCSYHNYYVCRGIDFVRDYNEEDKELLLYFAKWYSNQSSDFNKINTPEQIVKQFINENPCDKILQKE